MEPRPGYTLEQLWADSEPAISKKTTTSYDVQTNDVQRAVAAIQHFPSPVDSPFIRTLGTPAALKAPPQTDTLAQRALEEWERTVCENKAVAILAEIQAGRPTIIHKDGGEMLIAIVLDRLAEAKALVDDPAAFAREMTRILRDKQTHPLIAQMMKPAASSDPPPVRKVRNLRNPWVSVQDVVLNSLEPSTLPSQPLPEPSHFYTQAQKQDVCSCRYGSCWCVTP